MIHDSVLFDFQGVVNSIREKSKAKNTSETVLDNINENTELEDLPLYKDYLSKFDVEHDLDGFELDYDSELNEFADDFFCLLRFVVASFSSEYSLEYNVDTNKVVLKIQASSGGQSITKLLNELWSFQIHRLFVIYLEEQINLANLREESEEERHAIDKERNLRLERYQDNIKNLKDQKENAK